jgi:hypothetical protein
MNEAVSSSDISVNIYEGNSRSKVPYFIPPERVPALSWQAWVVSTYIHHQIAVIVTTSGDVNRHSSSFKMATILKEWTKKKCIQFLWAKKVPPVEIHRELVTVYGANVMKVHVRKWRMEFDSG